MTARAMALAVLIATAGPSVGFSLYYVARTELTNPDPACAMTPGSAWEQYGTDRWSSSHGALDRTARCRGN